MTRFTLGAGLAHGRPLDELLLDPFERGLLAIIRHLMIDIRDPSSRGWTSAFAIAAERWGQERGLSVAFSLVAVVESVYHRLQPSFLTNNPLDIEVRGLVSEDEAALLRVLHHMRRDNTPGARDALENLARGRMDAELITPCLSFANRFPAVKMTDEGVARPRLRVVK